MIHSPELINECTIYIDEINICIDSSLSIASNYCEYRGMMEGFQRNVAWLDDCGTVSTIRYINSVTGMLRRELITLPWKVLDCDPNDRLKPARLALTNKRRKPGDGIRSLTRASKLFKLLYEYRQKGNLGKELEICIIKNMGSRVEAEIDQAIYSSRMEKLDALCDEILILTKTIDFKHISAARHEGIAHSLDTSSVRINDNEGLLNNVYTIAEMLSFSETVMELIHEFDKYWRGVAHPELKKRICGRSELDQEFWMILKNGFQSKLDA